MGGQSNSTPQGNGSQLAQLFAANPGYQQQPQSGTQPVTQPAYPTPALTPEQAAAATIARMQARTPMAAPAAAPVQSQRGGPPSWVNHGQSNIYGVTSPRRGST